MFFTKSSFCLSNHILIKMFSIAELHKLDLFEKLEQREVKDHLSLIPLIKAVSVWEKKKMDTMGMES